MLTAIVLGFIFSIFLIFGGKFIKGKFSLVSSLIPLSLFVYFSRFIGQVSQGEVIERTYQWIPSFGVNLTFRLDGLSLLFSLMITGIGFLVFMYTSAYLRNHKYLDRFYGYLSVFMAAMLGLVLSDNMISLFVFWELTSISSFFLIGFNNTSSASRKSALTALGITGLGGLFLLPGSLVLGYMTGTYEISEMLAQKDLITAHALYPVAVLFIFVAAFTKSAQFPFHFWLPGAMKAPTPVSTYLHSATMVKAGIYLLLRLTPVLGEENLWNTSLIIIGAITMLYSAVHTIFRRDLKGILAYSTIAALGILVFLIGLGTKEALLAAGVFIIVHALYKATLFLMTGAIDLYTGTRDVTQLSGLRKIMLPVAIAGILAAISNAGIPSSIGFIGKDLIYEGTLNFKHNAALLTALALLTNVFISYAGYVAGVKPFIGKLPERFEDVKRPGFLIWFPPVLLAALGLLFGLMPFLLEQALVKPIVTALNHDAGDIHLKIWHGFTTILALSSITIVSGLSLYFILKPSEKLEDFIERFEFISPKSITENLVDWFDKFSSLWTNTFQNGYLRNYIAVIIMFLVGIVSYSLLRNTTYQIDYNALSRLTIYEVIVVAILLGAIFYTVFTKSRLAAVASSGVIGYAICLLFVFYSAPDLAMTQFAIDTLTVILFVLVLYRLPKYLRLSDYKMRVRDGIISIMFGGLISILALEVLAQPANKDIANYYAKNAYLEAHGKNVVNVILVDFRGTDTMIEISVLTIAAIGVFGLLKLRLKSTERKQK
ncbi:putative monovalent cation/H+ antiporter subunit A [Haloflavibacter putidus]|uniref:Putative monovalent cation/H+ antiporter subunit A n=1 Tax=Haloflavibacter putidus TaxID=2576776 RepID=A0A507ZW45_9FLAO|nr:putative monovalent cation/H+ antiporter subunit A [Haloflavibacter putidus]TQD40484.1 putative monovalent cation/H+ antiporter subunit A [Haloflavibacter putidus]